MDFVGFPAVNAQVLMEVVTNFLVYLLSCNQEDAGPVVLQWPKKQRIIICQVLWDLIVV